MASKKAMGGETIEVDGQNIDNYLDVRLYFMRTLGNLMQKATEASTPWEELRIYKRWHNMIQPYISSSKRKKIEREIRKAEKHIEKKNRKQSEKSLDLINKTLYKAKPSLYFPAQPTKEKGVGFNWSRFLSGKKPDENYEAEVLPRRRTDILFEKWMLKLRQRFEQKDDDYMIVCTGDAGTGKSALSLHGYTYFSEKPDIKAFGLNREDHARSLDYARKQDTHRFSCHDEAQVQGRNAMKKYNRDLIDLYMQKRGVKIFDWWNNPQVAILDKPFFDGPVDALIYIYEDHEDKPRHYAVFTGSQISSWLENNKKLTLSFLDGKRDESWFTGWFRDYQGELKEAYEDKKDEKMSDAMESFIEKYGDGDIYNLKKASDEAQVGVKTFKKYMKRLIDEGDLVKGRDFDRTPTGEYRIKQGTIDTVVIEIKEANK